MATWYVRPSDYTGGTNAGTSYTNAWQGNESVNYASISAGDTVIFCGSHIYSSGSGVVFNVSGTSGSEVTFTCDYAADPGSITLVGGTFLSLRNYQILDKMIIHGSVGTTNQLYWPIGASTTRNGLTIQNSTIDGLFGGLNVDMTGSSAIADGIYIYNNTFKNIGNAVIQCQLDQASSQIKNVEITGNTFQNCFSSTSSQTTSIRFTIETAGDDTAQISNILIKDNTFSNCSGQSVWIRHDSNSNAQPPVKFGTDITIINNTISYCGRSAGTYGVAGGISVHGCLNVLVTNNTIIDTYAQGGVFQFNGVINGLVAYNTAINPRSGTPTANYQNSLPIDGNGYFNDNECDGMIFIGNYVEGAITTGNPNSGSGMACYNSNNGIFSGNVIRNCVHGIIYGGSATEGNNSFENNTIIGCGKGIYKFTDTAMAANNIAKQNMIYNCTTGISLADYSNPGLTESYNWIYCTTNADGITLDGTDITTDPSSYINYDGSLVSVGYSLASPNPVADSGTYLGVALKNGKQYKEIGAYKPVYTKTAASTRNMKV